MKEMQTYHKIGESKEDYLEAILELEKDKEVVRSIDLANYLHYSRPSVSRAIHVLQEDGFIYIHKNRTLSLTVEGRNIASCIYNRRTFFTNLLIDAGVDEKLAEVDAKKMEHSISSESFKKLKTYIELLEDHHRCDI